MSKPTAIIIGAGIGGLATAIQLAKQGFDVTIFEKNDLPGGRCQTINKDGHIFDTGPTMYIFPDLYQDFFDTIGENINDHVELIKTDPTYQLNFTDNTNIVITSDFKKMESQLEQIEPGSFKHFLRYMDDAKKHYEVAINHIISKNIAKPLDYFNLHNLKLLLKTKAVIPHCLYASNYFKHPNLQAAFTFQDSYLSLNPYQAPAIYSLFAYTELIHGSYLPKGGMYQVILALEKIARKYGVKIIYSSPVVSINVDNRSAGGITMANNRKIKADYVVVNTDLTYAYQKLLPNDPFCHHLQHMDYSCSAIVFHWATDVVFPQLKTHNLFFADSYQKGFDQVINKKEPPLQPHFYIQAPTRTDPSRAPENHDTLSVMIPINHLYPNHNVDWDAYKKNFRTYVIQRLKNIGINNIESHIKYEECYMPLDWQNYLNLPFGAVYGLHHNLTQLGYLRPKRQHQKYKNLFFVGASNHPGSGLPTILRSAQFTSEQILKQHHLNSSFD